MNTRSIRNKLAWVWLTILLVIMSLQPVWAQEEGEAANNPEEVFAINAETLIYRSFLPVIQGGDTVDNGSIISEEESDTLSAAFSHTWYLHGCFDVNQYGLWDDIPGAGTSDAALFWFLQDNNPNGQRCIYSSQISGVSTTSFPQLRVRVAVGDGALFRIYLYRRLNNSSCGTLLQPAYTTPATYDDNQFRIITIPLQTGFSLCEIQIVLDDDPANSAATRTSALIDDIQLRNSAGGIGWRETFANNN